MDIFCTGLVNVTTIINDDLQQNAVVAYFCRSASFTTCNLIICQATYRYFWDHNTLSLRVGVFCMFPRVKSPAQNLNHQ